MDGMSIGSDGSPFVFRCKVSPYVNPKRVTRSDQAGAWAAEGYDAVITEQTDTSGTALWCVKDVGLIELVLWRDAYPAQAVWKRIGKI